MRFRVSIAEFNRKKCFLAHLDLNIEHRIRAHGQPEGSLDIMRQSLLVSLLDRSPLLSEIRVLSEREKALELSEILEPDSLFNFQGLGDQVAKLGVALVEPSARGDLRRISTE